MDVTKKTQKRISLFLTLLLLTLVITIEQVYFYILNLANSGIIHTLMLNSIPFHFLKMKTVIFPILLFIFMHFLLYVTYVGIIWYLTTSIGNLFSLRYKYTYCLGILLWTLGIIFILAANSLYFRHSIFAIDLKYHHIVTIIYWLGFTIFSIAILLSIINFILLLFKRNLKFKDVILWLFIIGLCSIPFKEKIFHEENKIIATDKPNIFIISIEALRPDFIYPLDRNDQPMPFLANLLKESVQFKNSYTPIAQSFPAWMSLLTAKTPLHNGARSLYTPYDKINFQDSLVKKLKDAGYETMYAVDGQRFGDITKQIGFDHIISPPYGASELIIGYMSDFPLSNLISYTYLGKYFFPYNYANRSVSATYYPQDYIDLIRQELKLTSQKPLFLAAHFSASHWPYTWANDTLTDDMPLPEKYKNSLHVVDNQLQEFFKLLQNKNLLKRAIIVFLSDHGIGLGVPGDKVINEKNYIGNKQQVKQLPKIDYSVPTHKKMGIDTSYGYSTDILSLRQYQILLAFKAINMNVTPPQKITIPTSLMDIAPTLLDWLKLKPIVNADGISLLDRDQIQKNANRKLFFENGFTTPEIALANISPKDVLAASMNNITVDPETGLIFMTDDVEKALLKNKERAILVGDWLLGNYPSLSMMILVNIHTGKWTTDLNSQFARQAPIKKLLKDFYQYNQELIRTNNYGK